jgi:hypothetical protein
MLASGDLTHPLTRLQAAMEPDPTRWHYTRWNDTGQYGRSHCACGHAIRYEFVIKNEDDDRELIIGSTCIRKNVPYLKALGAVALARRLEEARLELQRELARQKREAQPKDTRARRRYGAA